MEKPIEESQLNPEEMDEPVKAAREPMDTLVELQKVLAKEHKHYLFIAEKSQEFWAGYANGIGLVQWRIQQKYGINFEGDLVPAKPDVEPNRQ